MDIDFQDQHSYARPELACVKNIHLELDVDFHKKVLQEYAILTIETECLINEVILDCYKLDISSVTDFSTGSDLEHEIGQCGVLGSKLTIKLPDEKCEKGLHKIKIEYKTSPNSPALYWLTSEHTADGTRPFLISNTKYTYARAIFPCQDSPSVKFTYTATIAAPLDFRVLMSAPLTNMFSDSHKSVYKFSQILVVPSYTVVIAVGLLTYVRLSSRVGVWSENCNRFSSMHTFTETEDMLQVAEHLCGNYPWGKISTKLFV